MPTRKMAPQLQVPTFPTFPLSSPIIEEISSPSCSSAEDKELERTRPFDFLVKATKHRVETKARRDGSNNRGSPNLLSQRDPFESPKRHSIRSITKSKKVTAKPVGLNLVTDFSLATPQLKTHKLDEECAPFVDLNDLKALAHHRARQRSDRFLQSMESEPRSRNSSVGTSSLPNLSNTSRKRTSFHPPPEILRLQDGRKQNRNPFLHTDMEDPVGDRFDYGLSPSDRHVMIGLSVPRNESAQHSRELDSAGVPMTPTIIVTPAREGAPWSSSSPEYLRPRATSSIYSQPTPQLWQSGPDVPPVPAIPLEHSLSTQKGTSAELLNAHLAAMARPRRSMSVETVIEDDLSHQREASLIYSDFDDDAPLNSRLRVDTQSLRPESQGWWTYLLSPLLGKKSPLSPSFPHLKGPFPDTAGRQEARSDPEKEISCFSPETPESAIPVQWQDSGQAPLDQCRSVENHDGVDVSLSSWKRQTAASMIKTPYFECFGHICSLTPEHVVAAIYAAQLEADEGETRDRGLIFAEAGLQQNGQKEGRLLSGNRGLLIDVDSPTITNEDEKSVKQAGSPSSVSSVDSWAASISDNDSDVVGNEKSTSPTPQIKGVETAPKTPLEQETSPPQVIVPACEPPPAPVPAPVPTPPQAPAPAPVTPPVVSEPPVPVQAPAPQFTNTISPPSNNIHFTQQPIPAAPAPVIIERNNPYYGAFYPTTTQPAPSDPVSAPAPQENSRSVENASEDVVQEEAPTKEQPTRPVPNLWTTTRSATPGQQQTDHVPVPVASANEPISPAFQRAAGGPGAIPMSSMNEDVAAPAPTYSQFPRDDALPPRYMNHSAPGAAIMNPTGERGPGEAQRQRLEREDAIGRKIGGFWRGRGCFSKKGCFGRPGREGRTRRRWYLFICIFFLLIIVLAIVLATTLTRKDDTAPVQSQWLNLTGYPPMPTGISTIAGAEPRIEQPGCIKPSSLWSCALPQGQQEDNKPYAPNEPNFRLEIRFRNGTYTNSTATTTSSKRQIRRRDANSWAPSPSSPSTADQIFLGNTTDGNSVPYEGETTPFYITLLSPLQITPDTLFRRSSPSASSSSSSSSSSSNDTTLFPNLTTIFPAPAVNPDGTAAPAVLYPLPESQPIRLYNRGQDTEHYGFYTYFDKSIFLASRAPLNGSAVDSSPLDKDGGSTESDSVVRCTWSQTRFLVQIWTRPSSLRYTLLPSSSNTTSTNTSTFAPSSSPPPPFSPSSSSLSSSATNFTRPGSFPYPVTITIDRHGGAQKKKLVYCYAVESDQHYNITDRKLQLEDRGFAGKLTNPASGIFDNLGGDGDSTSSSGSNPNSNDDFGGVDGGTGGCACQWTNWVTKT
ncbi:hypothetical protein POX_h09708 [Penicillium oxalicum]|uniref:hypothetical protein n=1 Tax=Penicillium oxalicum TaxID=69781 RepID=UPI0020B7BD21|nr:hypothetical protein POX_h09708 [Penicillium oxalicum]KAI2785944.1 hypothetical protein POX_h09708 [Penicillium oxalicum]